MKIEFNNETKVFGLIDGIKSAFDTAKIVFKDIGDGSIQLTENILRCFLYDPEVSRLCNNNLNDASDRLKIYDFLELWSSSNDELNELILLHNTKDAVIKSAKSFNSYKQLTNEEKKCIEIVSDLYNKVAREIYSNIKPNDLEYAYTLRVTDKYRLEMYYMDDCMVLMKVNGNNRVFTNNVYILFSQLLRRILLMKPKFPKIKGPNIFNPDKFLS